MEKKRGLLGTRWGFICGGLYRFRGGNGKYLDVPDQGFKVRRRNVSALVLFLCGADRFHGGHRGDELRAGDPVRPGGCLRHGL